MTVSELIEKLSKLPQDETVRFYEQQWENATWNITKIYQEENGTVILTDDEYI